MPVFVGSSKPVKSGLDIRFGRSMKKRSLAATSHLFGNQLPHPAVCLQPPSHEHSAPPPRQTITLPPTCCFVGDKQHTGTFPGLNQQSSLPFATPRKASLSITVRSGHTARMALIPPLIVEMLFSNLLTFIVGSFWNPSKVELCAYAPCCLL